MKNLFSANDAPVFKPVDRQQGIVLVVALIVLVLMTVAGLAMMRQMGSGVSIAGNLAFKQNATSSADIGTKTAQVYLSTKDVTFLAADQATVGYFSTWGTVAFDPLDYDWEGTNKSAVAANDSTGNEVRYVIHRMCKTTGLIPTDPAQQCALKETFFMDPTMGVGYGSPPPTPVYSAYFRITNRVKGVRNTISYTQVIAE